MNNQKHQDDFVIDQMLFDLLKNQSSHVKEDEGSFAFNPADVFLKFIYLLKKNILLIIIIIVIFTFWGWYKEAQKLLTYSSNILLVQDVSSPLSPNSNSGYYQYVQMKNYFDTQGKIIQSTRLADIVLNSIISKQKNYSYSSESYISYLNRVSQDKWYGIFINYLSKISKTENTQTNVNLSSNFLRSNLVVELSKNDMSIYLGFTSHNPELSQDIVNQYANDYIDYKYNKAQAEIGDSLQWLSNKLEDSKRNLDASQQALLAFQNENSLLDSEDIKQITNSSITLVFRTFTESKQAYEEVLSRYGARHPQAREAYQQYKSAEANYNDLAKKGIGSKDIEFELAQLENNFETNKEIYDTYLARFSEASLETKQTDTIVNVPEILDPAVLPSSPSSPNPKHGALKWSIYGLFIVGLLIAMREFLNQTFRTYSDLKRYTSIPLLGDMPVILNKEMLKLQKETKSASISKELFCFYNPLSIFAEKINHLRTNLLFSSKSDKENKVFMISSASQGEGKTTLSSNLAYSFSRLGKTIIVDCDLRRPRVSKVFNIDEDNEGLIGALTGTPLSECVFKVPNIEGLHVLASDIIPPEPLEMLSAKKFESLINYLRQNYDYIILDMSPVLPVSDSVVVSRLVDNVIIVVKYAATTKKALKAAMERFNKTGIKIAGLVFAGENGYELNYYQHKKYAYYKTD